MANAALVFYSQWRKRIPFQTLISSVKSTKDLTKAQKRNNNGRQVQEGTNKGARFGGEDVITRSRRGGRQKMSRRKWNEKRMDSEFDMVIVPSDGISMSASDSDESDWSIGWFEPTSKQFTDNEEDSFAVLMPCYGSPSPPVAASRNIFATNEERKPPVWSTMLSNLSRQPSGDHKKRIERWLSSL